jgi:hypothetical protein
VAGQHRDSMCFLHFLQNLGVSPVSVSFCIHNSNGMEDSGGEQGFILLPSPTHLDSCHESAGNGNSYCLKRL